MLPLRSLNSTLHLRRWRLHEPPGDKQDQATELERRLTQQFPEVWAEDNAPGLANHQAPVITELTPGATPGRKRQYPMPVGARTGILPPISRPKQAGILAECQSAWNTPISPVKEEGGQGQRPVQDLSLVNQATVTLHLSVPDPYALLSLLPPKTRIYTCLDLKDAFFHIRLAPASQPIFAFEWEDPIRGNKEQLTWTHLSQGFKNTPTIFGEALASDLEPFQPERYGCWLLQYVDDLLLATETWEECCEGTPALLHLLAEAGY
ncbi:hypothetical protein K5549_002529 [Capra hircus]|nr:hypothetical protein K5549_002529 [Capra hircus]